MALDGQITISYGAQDFGGGADDYQLDGPYAIDKAFDHLRLTFNVVVLGVSYSDLQTLSDALESAMRKRDQTLKIDVAGSIWTYTEGVDILNVVGSSTKTGDAETDRGFSRAYTCVVEGELPADDGDDVGLRDIGFVVAIESGRQHILSMTGVYTANDSEPEASENYKATSGADAEASTFLAMFPGKVFELVDEDYNFDRNNHVCNFSRQYMELLASQSEAALDDPAIRDHKMTFTETNQQPGDSQESIYRLRRVVGTYDCAVDIDETTNMQAVYETKVEPLIKALFQANYRPSVFTIDDRRKSYDETSKRLSVSIQFIYQKDGGSEIIEVVESVAYRELRTLNATPLHYQSETAAEVDVGWATIERIATRTVTVLGHEEPRLRINKREDEGVAGRITVAGKGVIVGGGELSPFVRKSGWNLISSTSQVTKQWVGDPDVNQLEISTLVETVVERWNSLPTSGTSSGSGRGGPVTGR